VLRKSSGRLTPSVGAGGSLPNRPAKYKVPYKVRVLRENSAPPGIGGQIVGVKLIGASRRMRNRHGCGMFVEDVARRILEGDDAAGSIGTGCAVIVHTTDIDERPVLTEARSRLDLEVSAGDWAEIEYWSKPPGTVGGGSRET